VLGALIRPPAAVAAAAFFVAAARAGEAAAEVAAAAAAVAAAGEVGTSDAPSLACGGADGGLRSGFMGDVFPPGERLGLLNMRFSCEPKPLVSCSDGNTSPMGTSVETRLAEPLRAGGGGRGASLTISSSSTAVAAAAWIASSHFNRTAVRCLALEAAPLADGRRISHAVRDFDATSVPGGLRTDTVRQSPDTVLLSKRLRSSVAFSASGAVEWACARACGVGGWATRGGSSAIGRSGSRAYCTEYCFKVAEPASMQKNRFFHTGILKLLVE
jgi:hypothetical protein